MLMPLCSPWKAVLLSFIISELALGQNLFDCPKECECLISLQTVFYTDCSGKNLTTIPNGIDVQTQILDLSDNILTNLNPELLWPLIYLEKLNLSGNRISALSSYSLLNLTSLAVLDLSRNSIKEWEDIHPNILLRPAISLKKLILAKNPLRTISNLKSSEMLISNTLHILDLSDCGFTSLIGRTPIGALSEIRQFKLAHNPIKRIQKFSSPSLRHLDLSHAELTYFSHKEFHLPSLTHLSLSHNTRLSIHPDIDPSEALTSIIHIDLSYCNMNRIPLNGFPALEVANLKGNMLRKLAVGEFLNNTNLKTLDLSSNSIEYIHRNAFDGLVSLRTLNLSTNVIAELHDYTFLRLYNLTELYLSRNYISSVGNLKSSSIYILDMNYCEIERIEKKSLEGLTSLGEINLSKNLISSIPDFLASKTLKVLDLRYNRLSRINNETFAYLPSLSILRLSENRFSDIWSASYFDGNPNLEEISIHDNTWRCDCQNSEMRGFYDFLTSYPPKVWNLNELRCDSPSNVSGRTWYEACYFVWNAGGILTANQKALTYFLTVFIIFFVVGFAIMLIRRAHHAKTLALREQRERELQEDRDRLREMRMRREQEQQRNAPDPRDLISPPSYDEALLMPRLDGSFHSLAGIGTQQEKKQRKKMKRRTKSSGDLLEMETEANNDSTRRRNRRRRQSAASEDATIQETTNLRAPATRNGDCIGETPEEIVVHRLHESDL